jgi:DNA-binding NarL/FixJ family response regulator
MTKNGNLHVLLVEDNPFDARLIKEFLKEAEESYIDLETAEKFSTAIETLKHNNFDAVLLDLSLPDAHGLETLHRMVEHAPDLPVVILTGYDDQDVATKALQEGAQDYIVKNQVTGEQLWKSILFAIERKKIDESLRKEEALLNSIVENPEVGIFAVDLNTKLILLNNTIKKLFFTIYNTVPEEKSFLTDFIPPKSREIIVNNIKKAFSGNKTVVNEEFAIGDLTVKLLIIFSPLYIDEKIVGSSVFFINLNK